MNRATILTAVVCLLVASGMPLATGQGSSGDAARDVIAQTKKQWAAEMARNTGDAAAILHDDCTMFVADFPSRLDGKEMIYKHMNAEASGTGSMIMAEMANEKVQIYGDSAVLSYNFMGMTKDKDGKVTPFRAKSTRVYVNNGGKWLLVHANFAPADVPTM